MLVTVGVAIGFWAVVEDKLLPLHWYIFVLPPGLANKVADPVIQIGPLFVGAAVGNAFTVTVVVYTVAGLQPGATPLLKVNE